MPISNGPKPNPSPEPRPVPIIYLFPSSPDVVDGEVAFEEYHSVPLEEAESGEHPVVDVEPSIRERLCNVGRAGTIGSVGTVGRDGRL